jgi:hypothetical protein
MSGLNARTVIDNAELTLRKRALYTGLQPFLRDTELMEALILWESRYADQPKFGLRYYVADLVKSFDRPLEHKHLLVHLVATMNKPAEQLLPDPSPALSAYKIRRRTSASATYTLAEVEAFTILVDKWLSLVQSAAAMDIGNFVRRNLDRLTINTDLKLQVGHWLEDEQQRIKVPRVDIQDLRKIINLFYIGFCEYLGPTRADVLLAKAVSRLKANGGAAFSEVFNKLL